MPACLSVIRSSTPLLSHCNMGGEGEGVQRATAKPSGTPGKDQYHRKKQPHPLRPIVRAGDFLFPPPNDKKAPLTLANQGLIGIRQRLILPGRVQPSTFSTGELNFCVRDGNRWNLSVIATGNGSYLIASPFSSCFHFTYLHLKEKGRRPLHPDNCTSNDSSDRSN